MKESQHNNLFDDIQTLCRDFRRQWKKGNQPRIEDYVNQLDEVARQTLFQNLLHVELEFRRRQGESPASDAYFSRFPHFSRLIRQAFFESTQMSMEGDAETPAQEETIILGLPAARRLGEYELLRELGRGGFGVVYAAKHLKRGEVVALKTLPMGLAGSSQGADDAERLHKFRQEFRQLSEVNHPNLVGMQTLEVEGNQWFLTMDLIDGVDFLEYVRPKKELDEERLRSALKQLVAGIVALHERGIVHRDLKPSNVLVSNDGRVTILDFGLVAELQQPTDHTVSLQSQNFAGTPRYAAPEQTAGTRSAAGDWYALGVMLYEALTGEGPFRGTAVQIIVKKQTEDAPQLAGRDGVADELAALVDQLLQREPQARPDAATICDVVGVEDETISYGSPDDSESYASTLDEIVLVGRERQLAQLEEAKQTLLESRQPVAVFVRGLSGEGKTSLIEKFLQPIRRDDSLLVLSGRCYDRESVPFKAVDCIIDALAAYLRSRQSEELAELLPADIPMLAQLFPVLRRVRAIADRPDIDFSRLDSRQIRCRAFTALRKLLSSIAHSTPIITFVDDLQWGDTDSAAVFGELLKAPNAPAVFLLGSYRSDEAADSPFLEAWRESKASLRERLIEVAALTQQQALSMLVARVGATEALSERRVHALLDGTHGNPYFIEQLIEGLDAETGEFRATSLPDVILRKLRRLPGNAASLLEAIAIAGQAVDVNEAASVSGDSNQALATITHMRSERLVRLIGPDEHRLVDTYHDKIRETVLEGMEPSQHHDYHVRFGEYLERTENITAEDILKYLERDPYANGTEPDVTDRVFDLAYHFHVSGDSRGFAYQLMAGELSHRSHVLEDALEYFKRAEALLPSNASAAVRFRLLDRLGAAHFRLNMLEQARDFYQRAIPLAASGLARSATYFSIAMTYGALAKYSDFVEKCDMALVELGAPRPRSLKAMLGLGVLAVRIFLVPRNVWTSGGANSDEAKKALQQKIYFMVSFALIESPGLDLNYANLKAGALAAGSANSTRFVQGTTFFAGMLSTMGLTALGSRLGRRTEELSHSVVDAEARAEFTKMTAITHCGNGNLQLADREFREAYQLCREAGVNWQATFALHLLRHLLHVIGPSSEEIEVAERVLAMAWDVGDTRAQIWGQYDIGCGLARAGDIPSALSRIEQARTLLAKAEQMVMTESIFLCTESYVLLQASDYANARLSSQKAWRTCKVKMLVMEYNARSLPLLIESIAGPEWTTPAIERRRLKQLCRESRLLLLTLPILHSPIHRARGRAFFALGNKRKALRSFERAVHCAERLGADYDRAKALLDLAAASEEGCNENRREAIKLLKRQESVIPYAERWLLGDQYDEQVVAPPPDAALIDHPTETDQQR